MRACLLTVGLLAAFVPARMATAHELEAQISSSGLEFLAETLPSFVPERIEGVEQTKTLFTCPGDRPVVATQRNTNIELEIHDLQIDAPARDRLRVDLTMTMIGDGELELDNPYACFGHAVCQNDFYLREARAVAVFNLEVVDGKPKLEIHELDLDIGEDDIDFNLADCSGLDEVGNWLIDFLREYMLERALGMIEDFAEDSLAPMANEMMVGFSGAQLDIQKFTIDAQLADSDITDGRVRVVGDIDLYSEFAGSTCIGDNDPGEPVSHRGASPVLDMSSADIGFAANYGLLDDALYQAWRRGMLCVNEARLAGLGIDTHHLSDEISKMMPGFPTGTEIGLEVRATVPPRVDGSADEEGGITAYVEGLEVDIFGHRPDGTTGNLHVEIDLSMSANLGVDPSRNVVTLSFGEASIDRLAIDDQLEASEVGFDAARIRHVVGDFIMPAMLEDMSGMGLMAPVFGFAGIYLIIDDVQLGEAGAAATIDLYRAPDDDSQAPQTYIDTLPYGAANPHTAKLTVGGEDDQVPESLLRYLVTVDGVTQPASFMKELSVGEPGVTKTYAVSVAAMDLADNTDQTPATAEVFVDGILPKVAVRGSRSRRISGSSETIEWVADDDTTLAEDLMTHVEVYRVNNKRDSLSKQLIGVVEVPPGQTSAEVEVQGGSLYRAEVVVTDDAGNQGRSSVTLKTPSGGCNTGGTSSNLVLLLLVAAFAASTRRRILHR